MSAICTSETDELLVTTLRLGDWLIGIPISSIREISRVGEMTPVPDAPAAVRGVINLRGDVVTVLDLRTLLGLDSVPLTSESRWVIVDAAEERIGLIVDRVDDVRTVYGAQEESLPSNITEAEARFFFSVFKLD